MYLVVKNEDKLLSKVRLRNFWNSDINSDSRKLFLVNLIESVMPNKSTVFLHGVFNYNSLYIDKFFNYRYKKKHKTTKIFDIWYASENIRPPYANNFNCILSWDNDERIPKNIFLPGWATELGDNLQKAKLTQDKLTKRRKPIHNKDKFACLIANNPESMRMQFLELLREVGEVDCYGSAFNNPIPDKQRVLKDYRFNLCFENDLYPNWVNGDKIFDAYQAECIPIWWGIDREEFINENAIVNVEKLGFGPAIYLIKKLELEQEAQNHIRSQPLLKNKFDFDSLQSKIRMRLNF